MCIRDSNFITPALQEVVADISVGKNWQSDECVIIFWPRSHAAEVLERKSAKEKDKSFGQIGRALAPVSYTHLDVYKRQAHNNLSIQ